MTRYVALFDSVTSKRLTMADLRYALHREEFEDVETVVSSDNVLFTFDERPSDGLEDLLGHMMRDRFDIDDFVAVRTAAEIRVAIDANPFAGEGAEASVHTHFLARQPDRARFDAMLETWRGRGEERFALGDRALFIEHGTGVGRSKLTSAFVARQLGCEGVARDRVVLTRILDKLTANSNSGS